mmetsp:Transcript_27391/g.62898  ORF Transcript_27391/g.62898 Transcript_27391/m.62898 type:complete len:498 (-) Transcript_27391:174-1667(-)
MVHFRGKRKLSRLSIFEIVPRDGPPARHLDNDKEGAELKEGRQSLSLGTEFKSVRAMPLPSKFDSIHPVIFFYNNHSMVKGCKISRRRCLSRSFSYIVLIWTVMIHKTIASTDDLMFLPPRIVVLDIDDQLDTKNIINLNNSSSPITSPSSNANYRDDTSVSIVRTTTVKISSFKIKLVTNDKQLSRESFYIVDYAVDKKLKKKLLETNKFVKEVIFSTKHNWRQRSLLVFEHNQQLYDGRRKRVLNEINSTGTIITFSKVAVVTMKEGAGINEVPTMSDMDRAVQGILSNKIEVREVIGILRSSSSAFKGLMNIEFLGRSAENDPILSGLSAPSADHLPITNNGMGIVIGVLIGCLVCLVAILSAFMIYKKNRLREVHTTLSIQDQDELKNIKLPDEEGLGKTPEFASFSDENSKPESEICSANSREISPSPADSSTAASSTRRPRYHLESSEFETSTESLHATLSMPSANADIMSCVTLPSFDYSTTTPMTPVPE